MTGSLALPVGSAPVSFGDRRALRAVGLGAVLALVLLVLQTWAPVLVHRGVSTPESHAAVPGAKAGIDADKAVELATHRIAPVAGTPGTLEVRENAYVSRFDGSGFTYTPTGASAGFGISLASVERGSGAIALGLGAWTARTNVAVRPLGAGMRERVAARSGKAEWDVLLASPPPGHGDLVIGARLDGVVGNPTKVSTADGRVWRLDLAGGKHVQLDEIVVKDATGAELHRALPTIRGGRVELRVPDAVLAEATYPLVIDPTVSDPFPVSNDNPGAGNPSVAFGGGNHLVAYEITVPAGTGHAIEVTLVKADGSLGPRTLLGIYDARLPDVAWNGSSFLVVRQDKSSGGAGSTDIYGGVFDAAGQPVGSSFPISSDSREESAPAVSAAGSSWLVVWNRSNDIVGRFVNSSGKPQNSVTISTNPNPQYGSQLTPDIAWNQTHFLVAWVRASNFLESGIVARRVAADGTLPAGGVKTLSTTTGGLNLEPAVASDDSGFLVVWSHQVSNQYDIYANRVDASGNVLNGTGFVITAAANDQRDPAVAYNGSYLVAWTDRRFAPDADVYGALVADSSVAQPTAFEIAATSFEEDHPSVARGSGTGTWVVDYYGNYDSPFGGTATGILQRNVTNSK